MQKTSLDLLILKPRGIWLANKAKVWQCVTDGSLAGSGRPFYVSGDIKTSDQYFSQSSIHLAHQLWVREYRDGFNYVVMEKHILIIWKTIHFNVVLVCYVSNPPGSVYISWAILSPASQQPTVHVYFLVSRVVYRPANLSVLAHEWSDNVLIQQHKLTIENE